MIMIKMQIPQKKGSDPLKVNIKKRPMRRQAPPLPPYTVMINTFFFTSLFLKTTAATELSFGETLLFSKRNSLVKFQNNPFGRSLKKTVSNIP